MAERVGFEPTIRYNRIPDFESGAFDHSATFPFHELQVDQVGYYNRNKSDAQLIHGSCFLASG